MALAEFQTLRTEQRFEVFERFRHVLNDPDRREWLRAAFVEINSRYPGGRGREPVAPLLNEIRSVFLEVHERCEIGHNTLRRFLTKRSPNPRHLLLKTLALFIILAPDATNCSANTKEIVSQKRHDQVFNLLAAAIHEPPNVVDQSISATDWTAEIAMFKRLLDLGAVLEPRAENDFFPDAISATWPRSDQSYYLLFRYSTVDMAILKTFLVIETPEYRKIKRWSFSHFVWSTKENKYAKYYCRDTVGIIFRFDTTYFLLGNTFPTYDKHQLANSSNKASRQYTDDVRGMELICFEQKDIDTNKGLLSGVMLGQAARSQPIVARVAALHLGSQAESNRVMWDHDVKPTEHTEGQFESDLRKTLESLHAQGHKLTGSEVAPLFTGGSFNEEHCRHLCQMIKVMIDNRAAGETDELGAPNRGAIETYAPSNRPRA